MTVFNFIFILIFMYFFSIHSDALPGNVTLVGDRDTLSCLSLNPPSETEMIRFLDSRTEDPELKVSEIYRGIHFQNESPELIFYFKGIHHNKLAYYNAFFKEESVHDLPSTSCRSVLCALEQYYGKKIPLRMLYIYAKYGITISPLSATQHSNYQNWKLSEVNDLLIALESIPPTLLPFKDRHLLRFRNGYTLKAYGPRSGVIANARIDVFELWNYLPKTERIATLIHEIGHVLGSALDDLPAWKNLPQNYVSKYAQTNFAEDFAESFLAYRVAPNYLKKISPQKYNFIRQNLFKGLEFTSSKNCQEPYKLFNENVERVHDIRREQYQWVENHRSEIAAEIQRQEEMGNFRQGAWTLCGPTYLNETTGGSREETTSCLERIVKKRATKVSSLREGIENFNEQKLPMKPLSTLPISRKMLSYMRQDLRRSAADFIEKIYDQNNFKVFSDNPEECQSHLNFVLSHRSPSENILVQKATLKIFSELCNSATPLNKWKFWSTPDLFKHLP